MEHVAHTARHPQPMQIDALTGIRGVAAIWVMLLHFQYARPGGLLGVVAIREIVSHGWLAVDLFFVLSGFIMMHVHGREFVRPTLKQARRFYVLRFIRIYPVDCLVLLLHIPVLLIALRVGAAFSRGAFTVRSFALSFFMLNGWGFPASNGWNVPSWSVSSEWFAYLLFPVLAASVHRVRTRRAALVVIVVILVSAWMIGGIVSHWQNYMLPAWGVLPRVITEFAMGSLAYRFYETPSDVRLSEFLADFSVLTILAVCLFSPSGSFDVLIIGAFVILVGGLSRANGLMGSLMRSRAMVYLGRISYSAYIVHALILVLYGRVLKSVSTASDLAIEASLVLGFLVVVLVTAHLLYTMVEEPVREWLRRTWMNVPPPTTAASAR
jgi:peptidoglycan/LPS O-acetylase OafA/YrhL